MRESAPRDEETAVSEEMNLRTCSEADAKAVTNDALNRDALDYHRFPTPSKISVLPTKDMTTQRDLALAYSPGGAAGQQARTLSTDRTLSAVRPPMPGQQ
jgi:malate dehydrogenase (oxaloacetate-decarboxylating)(NADP+)